MGLVATERPVLIAQPPFRIFNSTNIYSKALFCSERKMTKSLVSVESSNARKEKGKGRNAMRAQLIGKGKI